MRKIPPLKTLHSRDYSFLDSKPSPKPGGGKRRAARKIFSDMKYRCGLIETAAKEIGMEPADGVPANTRLIYEQVSPLVFPGVKLGGRNSAPLGHDSRQSAQEKGKGKGGCGYRSRGGGVMGAGFWH